MTNILAIIIGFLITIVATLNASLSGYIGMAFSMVTLHLGAAILCFIFVLRDKNGFSIKSDLPLYFYFGGSIGFFVSYLNAICMMKIGASLTIAIIIFGQMVSSCLIDNYGLFHMPVRKFNKQKMGGFIIITIGIVLMYFGN